MDFSQLKEMFLKGDPVFWDKLRILTHKASDFDELFRLSALRKKAKNIPFVSGKSCDLLRVAVLGGYSLYPLSELLEHLFVMDGTNLDLWLGDYDNYHSEILDEEGELYAFKPHIVLLLPSERRCRYSGSLSDPREKQKAEAERAAEEILQLVDKAHKKTGAEVIVTNFMLPGRHDLGAYRSRSLGSDWSFRKWVNMELGFNAPEYLHVCDMEFMANRHGAIKARDERLWFESKQLCSTVLLVDVAREVVHITSNLKRAGKKVLVLDLDNTLWGGVIAEDGIDGVDIGNTSAKGESFKAFQHYIKSLKERGILLAVASKNEHSVVVEIFQKHPEMVLRLEDFVSFKANWDPKSESIRSMAAELNLSLDSFVFVDDNPAEIEIVNQFVPEVSTILLGPDASGYVSLLQDCRYFEPRNVTSEDLEKTRQYQTESQRQALREGTTDMESYLVSLEMEAAISEFREVDIPRLAQLINKSNQFNLTSRRRSESDVAAIIKNPDYRAFSVRLKDRFGDYGLISIVIAIKEGNVMKIDTWLMSCRVLKRCVEAEVLNELVRLALINECHRLEGLYLPTEKNKMVADFYTDMGFNLTLKTPEAIHYELAVTAFQKKATKIKVIQKSYESI